MAWIFSLSAECGAAQDKAMEFAQHFEATTWTLSNTRQCQIRADTFPDIEDNWWCRVYPNNMSEVGITTPESAYLMTELGILLYQHLRSAPAFRYALVGVEVDEFRTYSELLAEYPYLTIPGLVLALESIPGLAVALNIQENIRISSTFRPFRPGYVWQPYEGEIYNPLMTSPDLKNKLNELLTLKN